MAETHNLQKRGETWYYYRRVPAPLASLVGKKFIKQSLGTKELKAAKAQSNVLNVRYDLEFAAAEEASNASGTLSRSISSAALAEYVRQHIEALDQ